MASGFMKVFHIIKLIVGAGGFPAAIIAFVFRKSSWDARVIPHTRASMMPESVHIQGMVNAGALAVLCLLLIIHSSLKLRKYRVKNPSEGKKENGTHTTVPKR